MLYVLSLSVDTILLLVFAAMFAGFVLALWLSVSRAKKKGSIHDDLNPADSTDSKENPDTPETLAENADASDPADDPGTSDEAETLEDEEDTEELWTPPEPEAFPARVVDMRVVTGNVGGNKRPKTGVSFLVTFLTDDGEGRVPRPRGAVRHPGHRPNRNPGHPQRRLLRLRRGG